MIRFNVTLQGYIIAKAAGATFNPDADVVISREVDGELVGGVIFQGFTGATICMHTAGFTPHWLSRDLLWVCFDYVFTQLKCSKAFVEIRSSNPKGLEFASKIGFNSPVYVRDVYPDGDLIILEQRRDDCRWLKLKPRTLKAGSRVDG